MSFEDATILLNNMTKTSKSSTITTTTTETTKQLLSNNNNNSITIATSSEKVDKTFNKIESSLLSPSPSTSPSSLPQHSTQSFNEGVKTILHATLMKIGKTNLNFGPQESELPPFIATHGGGGFSGGGGSVSIDPTGVEHTLGTTLAADMVTTATTTLPAIATRHLAETTTAFPVQTVATFIAGNKNRATTIIVYPTVSPESIVIPIVSCIFGFPILALIVICCLRRRAKLARERDRRRNYDMQDHAVSLVRFSPIHRLSNHRSSRAISLRSERSLSQGFTSLELDTVMEERSDIEQTQTEILNADSPIETTSYKMSFSS